MHWILPIAGIIAAIAFLILCIGIFVVLISVKKNLDLSFLYSGFLILVGEPDLFICFS